MQIVECVWNTFDFSVSKNELFIPVIKTLEPFLKTTKCCVVYLLFGLKSLIELIENMMTLAIVITHFLAIFRVYVLPYKTTKVNSSTFDSQFPLV